MSARDWRHGPTSRANRHFHPHQGVPAGTSRAALIEWTLRPEGATRLIVTGESPHRNPVWANRKAKALGIVVILALSGAWTGTITNFNRDLPRATRFLSFPSGLWMLTGLTGRVGWFAAAGWLCYLGISTTIVVINQKWVVTGLFVLLLLMLVRSSAYGIHVRRGPESFRP